MELKTMGLAVTAIGGVLGVMLAWTQLDLPWFASTQRVANVEEFSQGTREMVLNQEWFRIDTDMARVEQKLIEKPRDPDLLYTLRLLQNQKRIVEDQLEKLKSD